MYKKGEQSWDWRILVKREREKTFKKRKVISNTHTRQEMSLGWSIYVERWVVPRSTWIHQPWNMILHHDLKRKWDRAPRYELTLYQINGSRCRLKVSSIQLSCVVKRRFVFEMLLCVLKQKSFISDEHTTSWQGMLIFKVCIKYDYYPGFLAKLP